ncbi:hypothetical protein CEXT_446931 [Caerostris extrusa]|uniref:Uncharacterized protein n=1 Tax=Caerostris extrusa TaxID=172846 RepID=A0AAV4RZS1_CAEEX|nr:hypothetical protein CEXT_446931 [Caerostris extrusa]
MQNIGEYIQNPQLSAILRIVCLRTLWQGTRRYNWQDFCFYPAETRSGTKEPIHHPSFSERGVALGDWYAGRYRVQGYEWVKDNFQLRN